MTTTYRTAGLAIAAIVVLANACSNSGEEGLEQLIEQQSGEDVEIDFSDDGFDIQTDEGSFSVDDEGNFVAVGEDGEVITGDINADDNSINIESDDGNVVIEGDGETGSVQISGDEGDISFESSQSIPDSWPADVPQPTGLTILAATTFDDGTDSGITVVGTTTVSAAEYLASYGPMLEGAGLSQSTLIESEGNVQAFYENDVWFVSVFGGSNDGETNVSIGLTSADSGGN
jgi:hypothetical protein